MSTTPKSPRSAASVESAGAAGAGPGAEQEELWLDLGEAVSGETSDDRQPLSEVMFVVLDLETTGGTPADGGITEIGAVKTRGGEVLGEFQTLVRSNIEIPPFIAVLTGITNNMMSAAPPLGAVLPSFLEFIRGAVLVAHNAPYDIGFLKGACGRTGQAWPGFTVIDTVRLARHTIGRDEVANHRLGSLATLFGSAVTPDHRALHDAQATVHVLHSLLARIGSQGVTTLGDLRTFSARVPETTRRKRHLADGLPTGPGVYLFRDERGRVLYVGTSVNIRTRVRSYFTAAEQRSRMRDMLALAADVTPVPCATRLEAQVREIRLIAEHAPPYNRRSRRPERAPWIKLTVEAFPRLSVVRDLQADGATYAGPFSSARQAELAVAALHEAFPLRRCPGRLPRRPRPEAGACVLAELGRCAAPCIGGIDERDYEIVVNQVRRALVADAEPVVEASLRKASALSQSERFEEAAVHRDRLLAYLRGTGRAQRMAPLTEIPELVAARRREPGGWELALVRHGRLAGSNLTPAGADPMPYVAALKLTGDVVLARPRPLGAALPEETELILAWLEQPGTRLVEMDGGTWAWPVSGAAQARARLATPASTRAGRGAAGRGALSRDEPGHGALGRDEPDRGALGRGEPDRGALGQDEPDRGALGPRAPGYGTPGHGALGRGAPGRGAPGPAAAGPSPSDRHAGHHEPPPGASGRAPTAE